MIVVATTIPAFKCNGASELAWLNNATEIAESHPEGVEFFAAIEVDGRGQLPFLNLFRRFNETLGDENWTFWQFSIDTGEDEITTGNRLIRICTGRNLAQEYAKRAGATHILFVDSDTMIPGDSIPKLLEVDWPVAGGDVPAYGLHGPVIDEYPFPVEEHWNTAGFLLIRREVFRKVAWHWDADAGLTDDPTYQNDQQAHGFGQTRVRKDLIAHHVEWLLPLEERGHDRTYYR